MYDAKSRGLGKFAFHGEAPADTPNPASRPVPMPQQSVTRYEVALAEHERRHTQLREANEHLVMAALTAQELQAAAEQAQRRQAEFFALVAQELRNPTAPIRIATAMLGRAAADEPLLPRLQAIVEPQVAQISRFVGNLLEMSQVSAGALKLERQSVDMAAIIGEAVAAARAFMDIRLQHFELHLPECALEVHGDPVRLVQVVMNLLDNASKFTPEGGRIALAVEVTGDTLVMTVSDTGIGITAQALPLLFKPFMQDIRAIGYSSIGVGLGLTVVRVLVEGHGGSVVARSAGSGLGSQFVVTLPRISPETPTRSKTP
jgi:signal transduction histidine kinase